LANYLAVSILAGPARKKKPYPMIVEPAAGCTETGTIAGIKLNLRMFVNTVPLAVRNDSIISSLAGVDRYMR
jgi:hypothetical protein